MKNIKIFAFLAIFLLSAAVSSAWAWKGSGTSDAPYQITSAADLTQLATDVNGGESYSNMYFKQTADITLSGEWTPIGTQSNPFKGHYDGGGFAIRGLRVTGNYKHAGLFGYISSDRYHGSQIFIELKNINIVDCVIDVGTVDGSAAGSIAGETGPVHITGNRVRGSITAYGNTGGLIGIIRSNATVSNNFVDVTVSGTGNQYNQYMHPEVCLMVSVSGGSSGGSGNYYHDNGGNVSVSLNTNITATPVYSVTTSVAGLTISDANVTLDGVKYYETGKTVTFGFSGSGSVVYFVNGERIEGNSVTVGQEDLTVQIGVPYIDENGKEQIRKPGEYTVLTSLTDVGSLGGGWYVVQGKVKYSNQVKFSGDAHLILVDGAEMEIESETYGIQADKNLTIYGQNKQNDQSGTLIVTATGGYSYGIISEQGNITINGGMVTATATGSGSYGIISEQGNITLSWTNSTDFITASSYYSIAGSVQIAEGKSLKDEKGNVYSGTLTKGQVSDLEGQKLESFEGKSVSFVNNFGETSVVFAEIAIDGNGHVAAPAKHPIRTGYTFAGWFTAPKGGTEFNFSTPIKDNTTAYAHWNKNASSVKYIDENGVEQTATDYTVLTNDMYVDDLSCGWYVVEGDVKYTHTVSFSGDAHLILADGAKMEIEIEGLYEHGIEAKGSLTIYGQSGQSGTLKVSANVGQSSVGIYGYNEVSIIGGTIESSSVVGISSYNDITISGGTVTATGSYYGIGGRGTVEIKGGTIEASGIDGIFAYNDITINGGSVTATGSSYGIYGSNGISLGWTNSTDYIYASSYYSIAGSVQIAEGRSFKDENGKVYSGTIDDVSDIAGKTLEPCYAVTFNPQNGEGLSITGPETPIYTDNDKNAYYKSGETVTLTAKENEIIENIAGVTASNVEVSVTIADDKRRATFTMPGEDVTITATTVEVHTVSVPENLTVSDAFATINRVNYYKSGETVTLTATKVNEFIDGITGVTASIADNRKSATFTMPSEDVEISATISKIWGGDGSKELPYTIASVSELDMLALIVNSGNDFKDTYFEVVGDIAYTYEGSEQENNYTAIGNAKHPFNGKFNGNGHTISGIRINKIDANYQGLFGWLGEGAEVENVKLADVEIAANNSVGGIAGESKGSIRNCTVEKSVKLTSTGDDAWNYGGIVGFNDYGTVLGCTSSATLTASGDDAWNYGGIVGYNNGGMVSGNFAKNVTVRAVSCYGAVIGYGYDSKLENNFYTACTVNGVENATNVGVDGSDVTENNGAVGVFAVSLGKGLSITGPETPIYTDNDKNAYYMAGETVTLTLSSTNANEIIDGITGVEATLEADKKSATFKMPGEDVTITATTAEVYTVSVPENLTISDAFATIEGVDYYKSGETVTLTATKVNEFIDGITGVTATIAADRKFATFTMPSENVEISATISKIWGNGDGSKDHPYTIASVSELDMLALIVNSGNDFKDTYFEVVEDIVYDVTQTDNGNNYTAIGDDEHPFNGKFNGNGHTISGIRINKIGVNFQGLFGFLGEGAEVENVKLADVEITGGYDTGGIAGRSNGSIRNCTVEKSVKLASANVEVGGVAGYNSGTVTGCISSATLTASGYDSYYFGGIVGLNHGTVSDNLAINVSVSAPDGYGAVVGKNEKKFKLSNNFYTASTVAGVENATNVGTGHGDVTENNGAVSIIAVTLGEGVSVVTPENPIYTDSDQHNYYKAGETLALEINFAGEKKTATFKIPNRDVEIVATASELHTVSVPEGLDISEPYITIGGIKYYRLGETYTLTLTTAKIDEGIGEITGVTASIANDGKSATFTMPSENVEISATISKILWGGDDGRDGSKEHPYTIASAAELSVLALAVNSGNDFKDTYFEVVGDIVYDITQTDNRNNYTAIGDDEHPFNGKFNGNGHTISGIRIYKPNDYYQGLFGYLGEGAEVENVKLADVEITAYSAGGIAGNSDGSIRNCTVEKSVKLTSVVTSRYFGGIVGQNVGTVSGCTSSATLTATGVDSRYFGGIVGLNHGTVSGNTSSATLTGSGYGSQFGGIVGGNSGTVSNNIAKNVMVSAREYYGAVVGSTLGSKLENNFYTACTVNGVENATNVGLGGNILDVDGKNPSDVTENYGAVGISFTEPAAVKDLVYNKLSHELVTAGTTSFGTLLYSLDGEKYSAEIPAATNAKTYTVYYRVDKDDKNVILPRTIKVSIAKIPLTVTAKDKTIAYGDEPANDGVEYSGFIGEENESVLGGKLTYSYNYKKLDKVGKYTITPSGLTASNYEISFVAGALNVEPKATHYAAVQVLEDENGKRAEIDGEYGEGDGIVITEPLEVASVEFSRDFSTQGYSTIVLPFNVNTSKLSGVDSVLSFARIVKEQGEMAVGMKVVWEASASHVDLKANTPYMVKMTGAKLGIDGGVTLLPTEAAVTKSDAQNDGWEFRGTYAYKSWQEGDEDLCRVYGFAGGSNDEVSEGDFVKFTAGASLRPLRAYLINTNRTCVAPQKARANGDYVLRAARYSIDDFPESMRVVIVGDGNERTTVIGHFNTRTGEFMTGTSVRKFDLKGRAVRGTPSARGAYYGKRVKK